MSGSKVYLPAKLLISNSYPVRNLASISALKKNDWNQLLTANDLKIHKTTLFRKIKKSSEKRILIDACPIQCGKVLFEREGMTVETILQSLKGAA